MEPRRARVLVVDDREQNRFLFQEALLAVDLEVAIAESGRQALEVAAEFRPDVVLLDWQMPEMDGIETARLLKELDPDVWVVLVSGYHADEKLEEIQAAKIDGFLARPYALDDLRAAVREGIGKRTAGGR